MSRSDWEEDFGLSQGESYEPAEEDESFDPASAHVLTLLGPIEPAALGMMLFVDDLDSITGGDGDDASALLGELEVAHHIGLRALGITGQFDRDRAVWIASRSPIHLVACSGELTWHSGIGPPVTSPTIADLEMIERIEESDLRQLAASDLLAGFRTADVASGQSLSDVLHRVPLALMEAGLSAMDVRRVLVENPAEALTVSTPEEHGDDDD